MKKPATKRIRAMRSLSITVIFKDGTDISKMAGIKGVEFPEFAAGIKGVEYGYVHRVVKGMEKGQNVAVDPSDGTVWVVGTILTNGPPPLTTPTLLHIDKLKDHESMGKPTLAELHLDPRLNKFNVGRVGYDKIMGEAA